MVLDFAFLYQGPEEDSIKGGVFVGNTLMCSCQVDTHVNLYTSWDTQLWDKGVRSEGGRSLSTETVPGWRLKKVGGVAPDGEAEKPSLFPNLPFIWGESSQTSLEAGRQPSEPQLVVLKFRLQTCPSHRRHTLCCGFQLCSLFSTEKSEQNGTVGWKQTVSSQTLWTAGYALGQI